MAAQVKCSSIDCKLMKPPGGITNCALCNKSRKRAGNIAKYQEELASIARTGRAITKYGEEYLVALARQDKGLRPMTPPQSAEPAPTPPPPLRAASPPRHPMGLPLPRGTVGSPIGTLVTTAPGPDASSALRLAALEALVAQLVEAKTANDAAAADMRNSVRLLLANNEMLREKLVAQEATLRAEAKAAMATMEAKAATALTQHAALKATLTKQEAAAQAAIDQLGVASAMDMMITKTVEGDQETKLRELKAQTTGLTATARVHAEAIVVLAEHTADHRECLINGHAVATDLTGRLGGIDSFNLAVYNQQQG